MRNFFPDHTPLQSMNIHCLAIEIYQVANGLSTGESENLFNFKDQYTLHVPSVF